MLIGKDHNYFFFHDKYCPSENYISSQGKRKKKRKKRKEKKRKEKKRMEIKGKKEKVMRG